MDRELTKEERRRDSRRKWLRIGTVAAGAVAVFTIIYFLIDTGIDGKGLKTGKAEKGTIESSVTGIGKIVPLHEQTIVSPVATRIMEISCAEGDHVAPGQSLLRLDLQTAETNLRRMADEVSMKRNAMEQTSLSSSTFLTDLEMKIKAKEMAVDHLKEEVRNERRLDSIGSGTGERIREAELAYSTGLIELRQLRTQLENERKSHAASLRTKQLESSISERDLREMERTLRDARVSSPIEGTVTYLNKGIGTSISAGERLAVVADLSRFKIEGEIAETNARNISPGQPVNVRIGKNILQGTIASISPQSQSGVVNFAVHLIDDSSSLLRPGQKAELNVVYDIREDVVRIPNGSYFHGPGAYQMFVKTSDNRFEKRAVTLGDSNFDFVEVRSGIGAGEEVIISDMSAYESRNSIRIK